MWKQAVCILLLVGLNGFAEPRTREGVRRQGNRVTLGRDHGCGILQNGTVQCWGQNLFGQVGDGTVTDRLFPVTVNGLVNVVSVAAGASHSCALLAGGTVRCWGRNNNGQLGDGTTTNRPSPVQVSGLTSVRAISAGEFFTCAILVNGEGRCWGANSAGQLGDTSTTQRLTPVTVGNFLVPFLGIKLTGAIDISAGALHACAHIVDGTVRCWGSDNNGQLGTTAVATQSTFPRAVDNLSGVLQVSSGALHTCSVLIDRTVQCWGDNVQGQLGNGTLIDAGTPTPVAAGALNVLAISTGKFHSCLQRLGGTVECWGANDIGQLGDGTLTSRTSPQFPVGNLSNAVAIASRNGTTCALRVDDSVRCWGLNASGQIGDGSVNNRNSSVLTLSPGGASGKVVGVGHDFGCAIRADGTVAYWGINPAGQLGNGTLISSLTPVTTSVVNAEVDMSASDFGACSLSITGAVRCWGFNGNGEIGDGTKIDRPTPVSVSGLNDAIAISHGQLHACALRLNGSVVCWGSNIAGQLGDGTTTQKADASAGFRRHGRRHGGIRILNYLCA